jgi:hypothetical protein
MPAIDGPPTTLMPLDVDALVERWRTGRAAVDIDPSNLAPGITDPNATRSGVEERPVRARRWWHRGLRGPLKSPRL